MTYDVVNKKVIGSPISTSDGKKHLNIEDDFIEDDDYIDGLIKSSERYCSGIIGSDIFKTEVTHSFNKYNGGVLRIKENPLLSFTGISYIDIDDNEVPIDEADYKVIESQFFFDVEIGITIDTDKLILEYVTGFDDLDIPTDMYHAIKIYLGTLYDQERAGYGDYKMKANRAVQHLLAQYIKLL